MNTLPNERDMAESIFEFLNDKRKSESDLSLKVNTAASRKRAAKLASLLSDVESLLAETRSKRLESISHQ